MTAAGLALIAGGLATLICFRTVLFRRAGGRRAGRATRPGARSAARTRSVARTEAVRAIEAPRRRNAIEAPHHQDALEARPAEKTEKSGLRRTDQKPRRSRRRSSDRPLELVEAPIGDDGPVIELGDLSGSKQEDEKDHGGLASIGFAAENEDEFEDDPCAQAAQPEHDDAAQATDDEPPLDRSPRRVGHRVEGWVRPEYQDHDLPAGDYWTPLPGDDEDDHEPSAHGYGWPVQVERLPPVPAYEPATGFDLEPVAVEPTEVVPTWPRRPDERAARIRLPRSWGSRDIAGRDIAGRDIAGRDIAGRDNAMRGNASGESASREWPSRDEKP
jgi:hypothetical protein